MGTVLPDYSSYNWDAIRKLPGPLKISEKALKTKYQVLNPRAPWDLEHYRRAQLAYRAELPDQEPLFKIEALYTKEELNFAYNEL